ncbi:suppressor of lurcher protein 1 [Procambarus clarkii]|uniref:suppressor of lurcher protein 1 n=1 Tax=Procambarus clarkii TaxID=6728 RepID=UPI001E678499|nr:suppressor of lurcher protein 1-like [Procambarus clarkii]XP_045623371.1 suppressor of lurcher protein 1-like [Procambarus clarkii]XP_045623372.1 suppressor of lurcher protein 1-like [Procambarus clarkii]XP_045623373.1 suppressor of lurcher protein 1-like [Procambarus clarkii]XP_045623374.1 suppressor of lurcher protein 1-like [Procambarus clarkii]XP_045623375.1 suppressor of lurcher protein 1-like [Procambarus clarkii]XP_045623376.1 suppressor of lurcher protein 1-like [Procambarus clarki
MKITSALVLVTAFLVVSSQITNLIPRRCNETITSEEASEGVIASPDSFGIYRVPTTCTYTFRGSQHQRVQLLFTAFALREPPLHLNPHERCLHTDSVAVYNLVGNTKSDLQEVDTFCGLTVPLPVMSSTSGFQVVFTTRERSLAAVTSLPTQHGFSAKFKFVTNLGVEGGQQPVPGVCQFVYNSSHTHNGTLYSPNPEGYYPQDTTCTYLFYGHPGQVVRLTFKYFDVEGVMPCNEATDSDYLEFSNFPSVDRKIPSYCGSLSPSIIQSDGTFFRLTFRSNSKFSGTGFAADYQFLDMSYQPYAIKKVIVMTTSGSAGPMSVRPHGIWALLFPYLVYLLDCGN